MKKKDHKSNSLFGFGLREDLKQTGFVSEDGNISLRGQ